MVLFDELQRLGRQGISSSVDLFFYDFHLFSKAAGFPGILGPCRLPWAKQMLQVFLFADAPCGRIGPAVAIWWAVQAVVGVWPRNGVDRRSPNHARKGKSVRRLAMLRV